MKLASSSSVVTAPLPRDQKAQSRLSWKLRNTIDGYLFISPWLIGFAVLVASPLIFSFWLSLQKVTALAPLQAHYIGVENYKEALFIDVKFVPGVAVEIWHLALDLPIILVFSLSVALLVSQRVFARAFFRAVLFMPVVIGSAFVIQQLAGQGVGQQALVSDTSSLQQAIEIYVGKGSLAPILTLINQIVFILWQSGIQILIFIAALHSIPQHLYEAAHVDGGSNWGIFWKITLPLLTPFILVNVVYTIVDSFTGPFNQTLAYIHDQALAGQLRLDYGAALGWIYFMVIFLILTVIMVWSARYVQYVGERQP
jgi:ABC-type sugar transport system permease subunit